MKETFAQLEEVRPGRRLFVREWILGAQESEEVEAPGLQMVCVHGSCSTEALFHSMCKALDDLLLYGPNKRRIKCVLFDMIGCGQSPVVTEWEAYSGEEMQQDLGAIVEQHTDSSVPVLYVAHSYGPSMLFHWINKSSRAMENAKGFVLLGACVRVNSNKPYPGGHPIFMLPLWLLNYMQGALTKEFLMKAVDPSNEELVADLAAADDANDMYMVKAFYRQTVWATSDDLLAAVQGKPVLHIHGVNDGIIEIAWGQHLVNQLQSDNVEFVPMDQASHLVHAEKPAEVGRKVCDFIMSLLSTD